MNSTLLDMMHDDITWCGNECDDIECFRNMHNKRMKTGLFSMAYLKGTTLCPSYYKEVNECEE